MLHEAMAIREVPASSADEAPHYEVYDSDTGTPLGTFETYEAAETEMENMKASNRVAIDPPNEEEPDTE